MTNVAVIYDHLTRPDTTGGYCLRALAELTKVEHLHPTQLASVARDRYDLFLFVDDSFSYPLPEDLRPQAYWAIDTHIEFERSVARAAHADYVFAAQKNGAEQLTQRLGRRIEWLPLACDPAIHARQDVPLAFNVAFVGNMIGEERKRLVRLLQGEFIGMHAGRHFFEDMAAIYSGSRIVFNRSVVDDVNMRVFEALCTGSLLVTNDLAANGQAELFEESKHLVTYAEDGELLDKIRFYLKHDGIRDRIAAAGRAEATAKHTYRHRMASVLRIFSKATQMPGADMAPEAGEGERIATAGLTSIVMLTSNQLDYTKLCLASLRAHTDEPYELIIVDNGSTDGTVAHLQSQSDVRLVANSENRGFPAAVNQGIKESKGDYVVLLNNDCILTAGWLTRLMEAMHSAPDVGLTGPVSNCVSGVQQIVAGYQELADIDGFAAEWSRSHRGERLETDRLVAFCLLIKRSVIDRVGVLDERFGLGNFEDDDFCRRALEAGYRALVVQDAFVHHFGSITYRSLDVDFKALLDHNRQLYERKWAALTPLPPQSAHSSQELEATNQPSKKNGMSRPRLSVCMIVRDSARTLGACLESIRPWVDEMIVVDTGSVDATPSIAEQHGAKVSYFPWRDDFSAARNASLERASGEWLFWMDSDDTIDADNGRRLRALIDGDHPADVMGYVAQVHCPHEAGGEDFTAVDHVKIFRNLPTLRFDGRIHEQILPAINQLGGQVAWTDIFVVHSGYDHTHDGQIRKLDRDLRLLTLENVERPDHPFTLFNLGMTYLELRRFDEAAACLRRSVGVAGSHESHVPKAFSLLIQALSEADHIEEAWRYSEDGLDRYPDDPELLFRAGVLAKKLNRPQDAERHYLGILAHAPSAKFRSLDRGILSYKTRQNLACLYEEQGKYVTAEEQWRVVLTERPQHEAAWRGLIAALIKQGRPHDARQEIEQPQALRLPPLLRNLLRGDVEAAIGDWNRARRCYESAIEIAPERFESHDALCRLLFERGTVEDAEAAIQGMVERFPDNASAQFNLGTVRMRQGRFDDAAESYRATLALRPHYERAIRPLAECCQRLGLHDEAAATLALTEVAVQPRVQVHSSSDGWSPHSSPFHSVKSLTVAVEQCLQQAEQEASKLSPAVLAVPGMTSSRIRHLLNRLGELPGCRYFEVGTFLGATALAASFGNQGHYVSIDNFSEFSGHDTRAQLHANLERFRLECRVDFREADCWEEANRLPENSINVYLYDGDLSRRALRDSLLRFDHALADSFVLLVDDWNFDEVRKGIRDAFEELGWSLVRQWRRRTDFNGDRDSWWNGLLLAVVSKDQQSRAGA